MEKFSNEVSSKIGNYVYRLIDPRNGQTFYVGKGKGNRVFDHVDAALKIDEFDEDHDLKNEIILSIKNEGLEVIHVIHRHEIPDFAIDHVEAALIDAYAGLTNIQGGIGSSTLGPMNTNQIIKKYSLPEFEFNPKEKLVFININNIKDRSNPDSIYQQVKCFWRMSVAKARQADFIIAVYQGVSIGVFIAKEWYESSHDNRIGFIGEPAAPQIWERFIGKYGKQIVNENMKHIQNPIRYWNY